MKFAMTLTATALAFGFCLTLPNLSRAESTQLKVSPVQIDGFNYRFIAKQRLHLHVCKIKACGIGSKISYLFYPADQSPNFEHFKAQRRLIANILRQRAPKGATLHFDKPTQRKNRAFTVFAQFRKMTLASGKTLFTKSTVVNSKTTKISLISSAPNRATAQANRAKFGIALTKMIRTMQGELKD